MRIQQIVLGKERIAWVIENRTGRDYWKNYL